MTTVYMYKFPLGDSSEELKLLRRLFTQMKHETRGFRGSWHMVHRSHRIELTYYCTYDQLKRKAAQLRIQATKLPKSLRVAQMQLTMLKY